MATLNFNCALFLWGYRLLNLMSSIPLKFRLSFKHQLFLVHIHSTILDLGAACLRRERGKVVKIAPDTGIFSQVLSEYYWV